MTGDVSAAVAASWTTVGHLCSVYPTTGIEGGSDAANDLTTSRNSMVLPGCVLTGFELTAAAPSRNSYAESCVPYQTDYNYPTTNSSSLLGFLRQDVEQITGDGPCFDVDGDYQRRPNSRVEYPSLVSGGRCDDLKGYDGNEKTLSYVSELTLVTGNVASSSVSYSVETVSPCAQSDVFYVAKSSEVQHSNEDTGVVQSVDFAKVAANDQLRTDGSDATDLTHFHPRKSGESGPLYEPLEVPESNLEARETESSVDKVPSDVCSSLLAVVVTKSNAIDCLLPTDKQVSDRHVGLNGHCE